MKSITKRTAIAITVICASVALVKVSGDIGESAPVKSTPMKSIPVNSPTIKSTSITAPIGNTPLGYELTDEQKQRNSDAYMREWAQKRFKLVWARESMISESGMEAGAAGFHTLKPLSPFHNPSQTWDGMNRDYYHVPHHHSTTTADLGGDGTLDTVPITWPVSYARSFVFPIRSPPAVAVDPANSGKYKIEAVLDQTTVKMFLDLVGGEVVIITPKNDWAGFYRTAGEKITPLRVCLVSNNKCHTVIDLNDVLQDQSANPTILIAENLDRREANEIVALLR